MRKSFVIVLMLSLVLIFSLGVLAQSNENGEETTYCDFVPAEYWEDYGYLDNYVMIAEDNDGLKWFNDHGDEYVLLPEINRDWEALYKDSNRLGGKGGDGGLDMDQELIVRLPIYAYIPCYIEMTLTGNEIRNEGQSFGPDTNLLDDKTNDNGALDFNNILLFDNQVGGFVNGDWMSLGAGRNAEIEPDEEVFIAGCDIFCVKINSNEDYKYEVWSKELDQTGGDDTLELYMVTKVNDGSWSDDFIFGTPAEGETHVINEIGEYIGENRFLHNFKVPYNMVTHHGEYTGEVLFRVVSI